jgi:hypothetical protein
MRTRVVVLLLGIALLILTACSESPTSTRPPAADLGLRRKGLSPSEVDLPCTQAGDDSDFEITSCRAFRHMGETVHVLGEVENIGDSKMSVTVEVTGYTEGGQATNSEADQIYIDPVLPGERAPYRIFFDARDAGRIELSIIAQLTEAEPQPTLEVSNVTLSEPSSGYSHVEGEVTNPNADAIQVTIIAVLRDTAGEAVEVHRTKLIKPVPSGTSEFDVLALHHGAETVDVTALVR